jgi:hydrogenase/urease accessory protein HupE
MAAAGALVRTTRLVVLLGALLGGAVPPAFGHGLDPAFLGLRATGGGTYEVTWRTAAARLPGADVQPVLPARCRQVGASTPEIGRDHVTLHWVVACGPGGLAGETIGIRDLDAARINALVRVEEGGRPVVQEVLHARRMAVVVPAHPARLAVVRGYLRLGIDHILTDPDPLLFVLGLLLLLASTRMLVQVITAFTVGHSITLTAAVLGLASVPVRPVGVLIAVSVLVLAVELAHETRASLVRRSPWIVALVFGLLNGFGFAGALAETGLPAGEVPLALCAFNLGIEIGQLAFVVAVLAAGVLVRRTAPGALAVARRPAAYALGILAAFWCFERTVLWLA